VLAECYPDDDLPTKPPPQSSPVAKPGAQLRVLVADDDELVCRAVERILRNQGFHVTTVSDGNSAVTAVMENEYDVILSDVCMPGTSGMDLMRVLRAYDVRVPVVLMTGQPGHAAAEEARELGAAQYLRKPVAPVELRRALEAAAKGIHEEVAPAGSSVRPTIAAPPSVDDVASLALPFERAMASLWMAYQPVVSVRSTRVIGYEAFVRTGEASFQTPEELFHAAEKLGKAQELCRKIRGKVADALESAPERTFLILGVGAHDLLDKELASEDSPLARHAKRIVLQVKQSSRLTQIQDLDARLHILRFMGFRVAVDDMSADGSGLSSFAQLEPDFVKIDGALVRELQSSMVRKRIVRTVIGLCDGIDVYVIAEGVETAEERDCLRQLGVDFMQGSFFSRPQKAFPLTAWT
jgi:EAL domain-containing protein (putative c-di-GMP-specific phosphodiesterase class I)